MLYLQVPTEYLEEHGAARMRSLALELAEDLPFNSGYVDLALRCWDVFTEPEFVELLHTRYPGIHMVDNGPDMHVGHRVDGVHWMNFLGQPVLGQLGGVAGLRERLPQPEIVLQELSGDRVLLVLGEEPDAGEGHALPLHRALARVLEPYLYHKVDVMGGDAPEDHLRWARRFLT